MNEAGKIIEAEETLLLGEHVLDQVAHTAAVAELVVVPARTRWKDRKRE